MKNLPKSICLLILFLSAIINIAAQDEGTRMKSFVPSSKAYDIYHPANFVVKEDGNVLTITDPNSPFNITVSSYLLKKKPNDQELIELLNGFMNEYFGKELSSADWSIYESKFDNLTELRLKDNDINWIWWGISSKKRIVILSINKEKETITEEEIEMVRFMIDNGSTLISD